MIRFELYNTLPTILRAGFEVSYIISFCSLLIISTYLFYRRRKKWISIFSGWIRISVLKHVFCMIFVTTNNEFVEYANSKLDNDKKIIHEKSAKIV